jgi:radical SAM-linked protein
MLPETKNITSSKIFKKISLPVLEAPQTIRIKFFKIGSLQFISHLDLQRTMARVMVRAGIPVWYTKGFNPHAKMIFAAPLSVGSQSICEYMDIKIDRKLDFESIMNQMNEALTSEMQVTEVYIPQTKFEDIGYSEYEFEIFCDSSVCVANKISELLSKSPLNIVKRTKSGEKETDISGMIKNISVLCGEKSIKINALLATNSVDFLSPEYLMTALKNSGVFSQSNNKLFYNIIRKKFLLSDLKTEFK